MMKQLLDEVKSAPLDDAARVRLAEIHERSIKELEDGLAPELVEELERITLPFPEDGTPSDAELRIAQAQLVGWLEGLFHGIQTALAAQHAAREHAAAQAQLRQLPPGTVIAPGVVIGENGEPQRAAAPRPGADHLAACRARGPGPRSRPVPVGHPWDSSAPPGRGGKTTPNSAKASGGAPMTASPAASTATTRSSRAWRTRPSMPSSWRSPTNSSALSGRVRQVCVEAQRRSPSEGLDIPGALAGVHRALSTAGNSLATTAEAAAMLRLAVGPVPAGAESVRRRAESVLEQVNDAERRLAEAAADRTERFRRPPRPRAQKFPVKRLA